MVVVGVGRRVGVVPWNCGTLASGTSPSDAAVSMLVG